MSTFDEIEQHLSNVEGARKSYLRRHGWKETCNTPGSYWLWVRDFAAEDQRRQTWWEDTCKRIAAEGRIGMPSPPRPMGVVTAPCELAVSMTRRVLDADDEASDEDDAALSGSKE